MVKNISNDCLLVNLDVKSLYTKIPNNGGKNTETEAYDNQNSSDKSDHNVFHFNNNLE